MQCKPRRRARTPGEKPLPRGSAHCGHAKTPNDRGLRPRCRACRTNGRQGSPALHDRSAAPNGSQKHIPRPASGSSVPDRSTGDPSMNNEAQARCEARKDRAQYRSSAPNDLQEPRRQDETRRTVDLGHSSDGPSWIDLAENRVTITESRFAVGLNRLLQQNLPIPEVAGYSMISSAIRRKSRVIVRPRSFAVLKFMTSSNRVGCSTGNSDGFAPLNILSTNEAADRNSSARFAPYDMRPPASTNSRA